MLEADDSGFAPFVTSRGHGTRPIAFIRDSLFGMKPASRGV